MLINLRNGLMACKRLPYDAEVEYLESTGTQYIETNIIDDPANNSAYITFSIPTSTSSSMFLFGSSAQRFNYVMARWGSNRYNFGPTASTTPALPISVGDPHVGTCTLTNGEMTYTLDGVSGVYSTSIVYNNLPLAIFRIHNTASLPFVGRVHGFKVVRKSDGMVIADLIPVRKGTVGYLYDRVSGALFGNEGTGDFVLGQDVVPVEWLESHGTEYIDLDYLQASKLRVKFDASIASSYTSGEMDIISNQYNSQGAGRFAIGVYQSRFFAYSRYVDNDGNATSGIVSPDTMYSVDCTFDTENNTKTLSVDGIDFTINKCTGISNSGNRVRLFSAANTVGSTWRGRIKFLTMWKDDVLWYNHIPVRIGTDATSWEGAMMDVLTRRIYRNQGTGAFAYGNDLKYPIPA